MSITKKLYISCIFLYIYIKKEIKKLYHRYFINDKHND